MKKTLIIILIIISSCASSKQQRSLIDQQADKIDEINQLNSSTFDLGKYFEKEKGTFTISTHNNELKKIIIDSRMNNDQNTITIFIKKNQPFLIRQNLVSILKLYKDDGNVETQDLKSKTDFYISNWKRENYYKYIPNGFSEIPNEYQFKKEMIDKIILEFANRTN